MFPLEVIDTAPNLQSLDCHMCGVGVDYHEEGATLWLQRRGAPLARCKSCTERELRAAVSVALIRMARMNLAAHDADFPGSAL